MRDSARVSFPAVVIGSGNTAAGIVVPPDVVETLDHGKRPPVRVTIGERTYRSTVAVMGGRFMVGVSAENRVKAGVLQPAPVARRVDEGPRPPPRGSGASRSLSPCCAKRERTDSSSSTALAPPNEGRAESRLLQDAGRDVLRP